MIRPPGIHSQAEWTLVVLFFFRVCSIRFLICLSQLEILCITKSLSHTHTHTHTHSPALKPEYYVLKSFQEKRTVSPGCGSPVMMRDSLNGQSCCLLVFSFLPVAWGVALQSALQYSLINEDKLHMPFSFLICWRVCVCVCVCVCMCVCVCVCVCVCFKSPKC